MAPPDDEPMTDDAIEPVTLEIIFQGLNDNEVGCEQFPNEEGALSWVKAWKENGHTFVAHKFSDRTFIVPWHSLVNIEFE